MTTSKLPAPSRARLRADAPNIRGLSPGEWYDVLEAPPQENGAKLQLRPRDALPGDTASYISVAPSMLELAAREGVRLFCSQGARWAASLEESAQIRFAGDDGEWVAPGVSLESLDILSDSELQELFDACRHSADAPPASGDAGEPGRTGLRVEARLKPGFAWAYRMLGPDSWYEVNQSRSSDFGLVIRAPDGERIIGPEHMELRSILQ